jgi:exonuclease VII large subunit
MAGKAIVHIVGEMLQHRTAKVKNKLQNAGFFRRDRKKQSPGIAAWAL